MRPARPRRQAVRTQRTHSLWCWALTSDSSCGAIRGNTASAADQHMNLGCAVLGLFAAFIVRREFDCGFIDVLQTEGQELLH